MGPTFKEVRGRREGGGKRSPFCTETTQINLNDYTRKPLTYIKLKLKLKLKPGSTYLSYRLTKNTPKYLSSTETSINSDNY